MKADIIEQFNHTWNIYEGIIRDFDDDAWTTLAHGYIVPVRLAFHILKSTLYYLEDSSVLAFPSGRLLDGEWLTMEVEKLPHRLDILQILDVFRGKTEKWLSKMDFAAPNTSFAWAGKTKMGVVIFLLRHTLYHLGEMNALLYESKHGKANDNFIKAFG